MRTALCWTLFLVLLPSLGGCSSSPESGSESSAGDETSLFAFDFQLNDIEGAPHSKADYAGKVIVADIWGTWCPPCRMEIPHFVELQEELGDQGLQMIGITDEQESDPEVAIAQIRAFTESQPVNYPLLLATPETIGQVPDFQGYPTTLFIDRKGNVRLKIVGYTEKSELKAIITKLLAESA